ncbi:MAG: efflux RND transporter permease subunit [Sulfurovum sp.]|nr:efflux RND transporter permease subunit [Sulfurovaceae bacterium]
MKTFTKNILNSRTRQIGILLITTLLVILSLMTVYPFDIVKMKVLPPKDGQTLNIYIDLSSNSTLSKTKKTVAEISKILEAEDEVLNIETFYGMGAPTDLVGLVKATPMRSGEQSAQMVVNLTKAHDREEKSFLIAQRVRKNIAKDCKYASDILVVEEPAGPPVIAGVVAEVYGDNQHKREEIADNLAKIFHKVGGLVDIDILEEKAFKKFTINIDKEKAIRYGLSIVQINKIVYLAFEGVDVAVQNESDRNDPVALHVVLNNHSKKLNYAEKRDLELKLSSLSLMNSRGSMISLSEVVTIHEMLSSTPIYSKNLQDFTIISAETDVISPIYPATKMIGMIKDSMESEFEITNGDILKREKGKYFDLYLKDKKNGDIYQIVWEGELQVSLDTAIDLAITLIVSVVLISTLLIFYYQSFSLTMIVLMGSILSLIGVMAGHIIMNIFSEHTVYFTGTSLVGVISLIGISARNTVLLIDNMKALMQDGMAHNQAIIESTSIRAKPILLTAVGVMLGSSLLIPDSVFGGLGISLVFGTVTATMASLLIAPILLFYVNMNIDHK